MQPILEMSSQKLSAALREHFDPLMHFYWQEELSASTYAPNYRPNQVDKPIPSEMCEPGPYRMWLGW